ncbi:MAG: type II secretion system ATPase GspE [Pseudomonas sp.]
MVGAHWPLQQVDEATFAARLAACYSAGQEQAGEVVQGLDEQLDLSRLADELPQTCDLLEQQDDAPIIRLLNALLSEAVHARASDIHLETFEQDLCVRLRIDGVLREVLRPRRELATLLVSRIKVMAQLDIAEKRVPQDGRMSVRLAGHEVDVRVSTLPSAHGERVVMRLLDRQAVRLELAALGMPACLQAQFEQVLHKPHGIFLVTGPTGSGKTTTLYTALSQLNTADVKIITVEDPVEYQLEGINQIQAKPQIGLDFANALRSIVRQDPDIIMIGEIRDLETAQIAVQASLTGHLVLATLHTNDAVSAVNRLIDMGVEPFLLASSLLGVLAQRLVRRLCPHCKQPDPAAPGTWRPVGCGQCNQVGYSGRTGIHELFCVDDAVRGLIHQGAGEQQIRVAARHAGMFSMREDGERWVRSGATAPEEILRVTRDA